MALAKKSITHKSVHCLQACSMFSFWQYPDSSDFECMLDNYNVKVDFLIEEFLVEDFLVEDFLIAEFFCTIHSMPLHREAPHHPSGKQLDMDIELAQQQQKLR